MTDDEVLRQLDFHPWGDTKRNCLMWTSCGCITIVEEWFAWVFITYCLEYYSICARCGEEQIVVLRARVID